MIGMGHEALAWLVGKLGVRFVVSPKSPYAGGADAGVDTFEAGDFVALLEEPE